jgi:hypothetical protein
MHIRWGVRGAGVLAGAAAVVVLTAASASATVPITRIGTDTFTNSTSQHATQVEPDSFAFGSTMVAAIQTGRFFDGGASDVAFATSIDNGASWVTGNLPGVTKFLGGGPYDRVSDPAVAFDAKHNVWMISTLGLTEAGGVSGAALLTSRSTDGGLTWGNPVVVSATGSLDKNWIVCDNTPTSRFFGNCYSEWDLTSAGDRIRMSTSSDGGLTWSSPVSPKNNPTGLGGQPVVQPDGTVIVPYANASESGINAFRSTDGGASWTRPVTVASVADHPVAGNLRTGPLPSAEIDAAGTVYVVWQDCRFRTNCTSNDIVMSTTTNGTSWSTVTRIPIDATTSTIDHFIPGIGVDRSTSGSSAHLALTYYYYPTAACSASTCQLRVGFISSTNGGASWGTATDVAGPMTLSWLANTNQGVMVGDYISTSFGSDGLAHGFFAVANAPSGGIFDEGMYTNSTGLALLGGAAIGEVWPGGSALDVPGAAQRNYPVHAH